MRRGSDELFPAACWLRAPLPPNWAVAPGSDAAVAVLVAQNAGYSTWNIVKWTSQVAVVPAEQPMVSITGLRTETWAANMNKVLLAGVPIPDGLMPTQDSDASLVISQPDWERTINGRTYRGRLFELWRPVWDGTRWTVNIGGRMVDTRGRLSGRPRDLFGARSDTPLQLDAKQSDPWSADGLGEEHHVLASVTKIPQTHALLREDDLRRGEIAHPLGFMLSPAAVVDQGPLVWPAWGRDRASRKVCPQGARFAWPPDTPEPSGLSYVQRLIFDAGKRHGFVFNDTAGNQPGIIMRAEPSAAPWLANPHQIMSGLPWAALKQIAVGTDAVQTPVA